MNKLFIFVLGAGIGSAATYILLKNKYDEIISEEIEQIKEAYNSDKDDEPKVNPEPKVNEATEKSSLKYQAEKRVPITDYANIVTAEKYAKKEDVKMEECIIEPDDFGEDYDVIYATYYSDGYLVDDDDHIIDIDNVGGEDILKSMSDVLHVRNTLYELDYEIIKDNRTYENVSGKDLSALYDTEDD